MAECMTEERRILMLGKIGTGKSQAANAILGDGNPFLSEPSFSPITRTIVEAKSTRNGKTFKVSDTPGLCSPDANDKNDLPREVLRHFLVSIPGFHCITIVISCSERFTSYDEQLLKSLKEEFGKDYIQYVIVIFTKIHESNWSKFADQLEFHAFSSFFKETKGRHVCFGNEEEKVEERLVEKYYMILEKMISDNNETFKSGFYVHPTCKQVERILNKKAEKLRRKHKYDLDEAIQNARDMTIKGNLRLPKDAYKMKCV